MNTAIVTIRGGEHGHARDADHAREHPIMTIRATRATFLNTPKSVMNTSEAVIRGGDPRRRATYLITPKPVINTAKAMIRGGQRV